MMYTCPKCGMPMYCVSTASIPAYVSYQCNCGYGSKTIREPILQMPLPKELRAEEVRKSVVEIIEDMPEAGQSITWHPVKEALPKTPGPYLGCGKMGGVYIVKFENGMFWHVGHGSCAKRVIAWAEMPEPYMEEEHDFR